MRTPIASRLLSSLGALLLIAPLTAGAATLDEAVWREAVVADERPALTLAADATLAPEPIPDVATPAATATSATVTGAIPVAQALSLAAELVQLQGDGPSIGASLLLGAAIAQRVGVAELSLLLARPVDAARPALAPPSAVLEVGAAFELPLAPSFAVRRTTGAGASTECNAGLETPLADGLSLGLSGRSVVGGGALDAGALVVLALR